MGSACWRLQAAELAEWQPLRGFLGDQRVIFYWESLPGLQDLSMLQSHCVNPFSKGLQAAQYTHCKLQDIVHQPSAK